MNKLAESIIVDIIRNRLELPDDQVWVRDQNRKIPPSENKLFVIAGMVDEEVIGSVNQTFEYEIPDTDPVRYGMKEVGQVVSAEHIQIDIQSRDNSAIQRRWELLTALRSIYAQQQQEIYCFRLFQIPKSFVNTSYPEGGSNLNKFSLTVTCHVWYRKENVLQGYDFYDDFKQRVDDDKSIGTEHGIIEFEIKDNQIL